MVGGVSGVAGDRIIDESVRYIISLGRDRLGILAGHLVIGMVSDATETTVNLAAGKSLVGESVQNAY